MPQNQDVRDLVAKMKLLVNKELVDGKKMLFCEDSIVRGTQLKDNTAKLFKEGAAEVHMRVACPPLLFPCEFLIFSRSRTKLDLAGLTAIKQINGTADIDLVRVRQLDALQVRGVPNLGDIRKRNYSLATVGKG